MLRAQPQNLEGRTRAWLEMPSADVIRAAREFPMPKLQKIAAVVSRFKKVSITDVYMLADSYLSSRSCYEFGIDAIHPSEEQKERARYAAYFKLAGVNPAQIPISLSELASQQNPFFSARRYN